MAKKKQFLVIGVGRFGSALARSLYQQGHEVIVIDRDESKIEHIMDDVTHALIADSTEEEVLRKVGVGNFDTVIVSIGANFEANILTTVAAKGLDAKRVISKATTAVGAAVLKRVGADQVIRPEHDMGTRLAQQLTTPMLVDAFELGEEHTVVEVEATEQLLGRLDELRLPNRYDVQVIAVNRGGDVVVTPGADFTLTRGDTVVLIGSNEAIDRFRNDLDD